MSLRKSLIRLAHVSPELRPHLLPLLKEGMEHATEDARKKYLDEHPKAEPKNHSVKDSKGKKPSSESPEGDKKVLSTMERELAQWYKEEDVNKETRAFISTALKSFQAHLETQKRPYTEPKQYARALQGILTKQEKGTKIDYNKVDTGEIQWMLNSILEDSK